MSITIRQHIPSFISGVEPQQATVNDTAALLALPWVDKWRTLTDRNGPFHRFSLSHNGTTKLMAEFDGGARYWVVGFVTGEVDLPEWKVPR